MWKNEKSQSRIRGLNYYHSNKAEAVCIADPIHSNSIDDYYKICKETVNENMITKRTRHLLLEKNTESIKVEGWIPFQNIP